MHEKYMAKSEDELGAAWQSQMRTFSEFKVGYDKKKYVESAKFKVSVSKSWLKANDIDPSKFSLYRLYKRKVLCVTDGGRFVGDGGVGIQAQENVVLKGLT